MPNVSLNLMENIESKIFVIRGSRVMMDTDIAAIYHVSTKRLNEQVGRNKARFPEDFMFQLTEDEVSNLRSQFATSSWGMFSQSMARSCSQACSIARLPWKPASSWSAPS